MRTYTQIIMSRSFSFKGSIRGPLFLLLLPLLVFASPSSKNQNLQIQFSRLSAAGSREELRVDCSSSGGCSSSFEWSVKGARRENVSYSTVQQMTLALFRSLPARTFQHFKCPNSVIDRSFQWAITMGNQTEEGCTLSSFQKSASIPKEVLLFEINLRNKLGI
jgi:hypothetical protein